MNEKDEMKKNIYTLEIENKKLKHLTENAIDVEEKGRKKETALLRHMAWKMKRQNRITRTASFKITNFPSELERERERQGTLLALEDAWLLV